VYIGTTIYVRVMNSLRWIVRMIYCACIEACILGLKEVYSLCYFLQNSSWHESWIIKIWSSKESINFKNMKWFSGFCITKDSHTSINLSQIHCRYWQGYNKAKSHSLTREQGVQHAGSSPTLMKKIISKSIPNPLPVLAVGITKPNLTHSHMNKGSSMLDLHPKWWKK
jgi:hypothetical protein